MDKMFCDSVSDDDDDIPLSELVSRQKKLNECNKQNELFQGSILEDITIIVEPADKLDPNELLSNDTIILSKSDISTDSIIVNSLTSNVNDNINDENCYTEIGGEIEVSTGITVEEDICNISNVHDYTIKPGPVRQSRKRKRNITEWKQNVRKRKRDNGEENINAAGNRVPRKVSKEAMCKCKYKCRSEISTCFRERAFYNYWGMDYVEKREFLRKHVIVVDKKKVSKSNSRRNKTLQYYLPFGDKVIQVCKSFFLQALCIKERTVMYNIKHGIGISDKRGKGSYNSKITEVHKNEIRQHIQSYPTVDSHYCRSKTQRKYLDKNLNIKKMYRQYCEYCNNKSIVAQKFWLYEDIFKSEFNLGFHRPKKDLCSFCETFKHLSMDDKSKNQHEYDSHINRKLQIRKKKQDDKLNAISSDGNVKLINFDLQKVLISPKTEVGECYYSRKYSTYNFTVFDLVSKQAECFMWHESIAKRGSCEIASCLYQYNKNLGPVEELIYYSDSCTGQQRNLPFFSMCLYSVVNLPIKRITHNYFERGHSQMEGDTVHALIERHTKKREIFTPAEWIHSVRNSKESKPRFSVKEVTQKDIFDFKQLSEKTIVNRSIASDQTQVKWNKIHSFQYRKDSPTCVYYKYEIDSAWNVFDVTAGRRRKTVVNSMSGYKLLELYKQLLPISELKYKDLMQLCERNVIPPEYHAFYKTLPHGGEVSRLPEPNESDTSDGEVY